MHRSRGEEPQRRGARPGLQKIRISRKLAESDDLAFLKDALADITAEEQVLNKQLRAIDARSALRLDADTVEDQLRQLADTARSRMTDPALDLMAEVFDPLGIDVVRVSSDRFEGTGSIHLPEDGGRFG